MFLAEWKDRKVALKEFDVAKSGCTFQDELKSYARVRRDWGVLVPEPLFVSESWSGGVKFLGMQLGRSPRVGGDVSEWPNLLRTLEEK